jgi:hypothetical protein
MSNSSKQSNDIDCCHCEKCDPRNSLETYEYCPDCGHNHYNECGGCECKYCLTCNPRELTKYGLFIKVFLSIIISRYPSLSKNHFMGICANVWNIFKNNENMEAIKQALLDGTYVFTDKYMKIMDNYIIENNIKS